MHERYRNYPDRLDLVICGECSTRATLTLIERDEIAEHDRDHSYQVLRDAWYRAQRAHRTSDTLANEKAEQAAYDAIIEFVERHNLNYTRRDPRPHQEEPS